MDNNTVALAAIALASTTTLGLFKLLSKLSKSLDELTDSNRVIAKEAEGRNNHLATLVSQTARASEKRADLRQKEYREQLNKQEKK